MSGRGGGRPAVVVLGGGYVGSAVVGALERRAEVTVLDLPTHPVLVRRDAAARDLLLEAVGGTAAVTVVNCCGLLRGTDDELVAANAEWPAWLVEVLAGRPERLVHLGSASEYGDPGGPEPVTEDRPAAPSGVYGETKWAGSSAVLDGRAAGLDAVVVRGFNLVSTEVPPVSPLFQFRADVDALPPEGGEVTLWWPATVRDFILLADLGEAVARLALAAEVPDVVNACSGVGVSFSSIVEALAAVRGRPVTIRSLDRPGIPAVVGDPGRLRRFTGLEPPMSAELIAATIAA